MSNDKIILQEFDSMKSEMNRLFRDWELISGCSQDEFDHLSNQLLSHLSKGADKIKVFNITRSELISRYGLSPSDEEIQQIVVEVFELWEVRR